MANSTEAELVSMQSTLQTYKQDTNTDLQRNVFKKYVYSYEFEFMRLLILCYFLYQLCRIYDDLKRNQYFRE